MARFRCPRCHNTQYSFFHSLAKLISSNQDALPSKVFQQQFDDMSPASLQHVSTRRMAVQRSARISQYRRRKRTSGRKCDKVENAFDTLDTNFSHSPSELIGPLLLPGLAVFFALSVTYLRRRTSSSEKYRTQAHRFLPIQASDVRSLFPGPSSLFSSSLIDGYSSSGVRIVMSCFKSLTSSWS